MNCLTAARAPHGRGSKVEDLGLGFDGVTMVGLMDRTSMNCLTAARSPFPHAQCSGSG